MSPIRILTLGVIALLLFAALSAIFVVDERKQALVLRFGEVIRVRSEPGLGLKIHFIDNVVFYEDRILPQETSEPPGRQPPIEETEAAKEE